MKGRVPTLGQRGRETETRRREKGERNGDNGCEVSRRVFLYAVNFSRFNRDMSI